MHPELLNNSRFLRYYKQWQDDPSSIIFAAVADYLLIYGMIDAAMKVCREGLKRHPDLISGRIVMAKIHLKRGNWDEAESELRRVISLVPQNPTAREMMSQIDAMRAGEREALRIEAQQAVRSVETEGAGIDLSSWQTVTMADIFARQGHTDRARRIYQSILAQDPGNEAARRGIESLSA